MAIFLAQPSRAGQTSSGTTYEIVKIGGGFATTPTFLADIPTGLNTLVGVPNLSADANGDLFGLSSQAARLITSARSSNFPLRAAPRARWRPSPPAPAPPTREGCCLSTPAAICLERRYRAAPMGPARCSKSKTGASYRPRQPSSPASALALFPLARATWSKTRRATFSVQPPARYLRLRRQAPPMPLRSSSSLSRWGRRSAV